MHDRVLTSKGRLIASLRHDNELLLAEAVTRGVLNDLTLAEAAAVCSALAEESRSGEPNIARTFLRKRPKLRRRVEHLIETAEAVFQAQRARHLSMPVNVHPGYMPAVLRWASGDDDWTDIVERDFGGHEGDLIRAMRRLIDVLRQLGESGDVPAETRQMLHQAARVVDRGIVLESALI
jgi:ATP-dependent RNA helicase HelY